MQTVQESFGWTLQRRTAAVAQFSPALLTPLAPTSIPLPRTDRTASQDTRAVATPSASPVRGLIPDPQVDRAENLVFVVVVAVATFAVASAAFDTSAFVDSWQDFRTLVAAWIG